MIDEESEGEVDSEEEEDVSQDISAESENVNMHESLVRNKNSTIIEIKDLD